MKHKARRCLVKHIAYFFSYLSVHKVKFAQIYTNAASLNSFAALGHTRQFHRWWIFPFHEKIHIVKILIESLLESVEVFPLTTVSFESNLIWLWNTHKIFGHTSICTVYSYYSNIKLVHFFAVHLAENDVNSA